MASHMVGRLSRRCGVSAVISRQCTRLASTNAPRLLFSVPKLAPKSTVSSISPVFRPTVTTMAVRFGHDGPIGTPEEVEERTINILKMFDKVDPEKVNMDAHFINDLGLDSLDVVEIVMAFEDEFGIEVSDIEAEKIFTCKDAVEITLAKLHISREEQHH